MKTALTAAALALAALLPACTTQLTTPSIPTEYRFGEPEIVATFTDNMPTGVAAHRSGRVFVNFPRWGDDVPFTVAELIEGKPVPYPDLATNTFDRARPSETFSSVQSVVAGPRGLLWVLDTGSPQFAGVIPGAAKLVAIDPSTNTVVNTIVFPPDVAKTNTYLNDVRIDDSRGTAGLAYITDSALRDENAIIVADLDTGESWRKLAGHPSVQPDDDFIGWVEGRPFLFRPDADTRGPVRVGADGLALSADGERLWYTALSSRKLYSVALDDLAARFRPDAAVQRSVIDHGDRGFASDGLESDEQGRLYLTNYEDNAIVAREPDGSYTTILHDPRLIWPDTLSLDIDGNLYITSNQLHRQPDFQHGNDSRQPPYILWKLPLQATPIRLTR